MHCTSSSSGESPRRPAIPRLDPRHIGVRIAQLSDIHVGNLTPESHIRAAIDVANAATPDLIVLTGDYVCWRRHEAELAGQQLGGLRAPRVLAVLGSHDFFTHGAGVRAALERNGLRGAAQPHVDRRLSRRAARHGRCRRPGDASR